MLVVGLGEGRFKTKAANQTNIRACAAGGAFKGVSLCLSLSLAVSKKSSWGAGTVLLQEVFGGSDGAVAKEKELSGRMAGE